MSVLLEAIKFNHDPASVTKDALNIRKNATQFVTVPEWQRNFSVNAEDSPAAYSIKETQGQTITIQAKFQRTDPSLQTIEVRAIDAQYRTQGCLYAILRSLGIIPFLLPQPGILGEVAAKQVTFLSSGETNFETFELEGVRICHEGVGVHTVTWQWQYRLNQQSPWIDLTTTNHKIYTVLETPKLPWQQTPYQINNQQLPWTEVLDYACNWASRAYTLDDAATLVTNNIFNLGPTIVEYDCPNGGSTHYASPNFNCTAFLERLRGGIGLGRYINCTDCATITSTFANILGCDLWQSRMGYGFELNPILAIGSSVWQTACGWNGFSYHEVAWKGACTSNDEVFDACLKVDADADPTTAPQTPLLPANLVFGNPGSGLYRDRLATPSGRPNCEPRPTTRQRRAII
jgi:hypothetical protein